MKKIKQNNEDTKKEDRIIEIEAERNIKPVLNAWVTEVFGSNPTKEDYGDHKGILPLVPDVIKHWI